MIRPIVWQIQEPPPRTFRDLSSCRGFGEVRTILSHTDNPSVFPQEAYSKLTNKLAQAQNGDYILWSGGDPMSAFLAGKVLSELGINHLRWLRWDKRTDHDGNRTRHGYYTPVVY